MNVPGALHSRGDSSCSTREPASTASSPRSAGPCGEGSSPGPDGVVWHVVGGATTGGILVRSGKPFTSPPESKRLSTGALVKQIALEGERLHYERLTGEGPARGWVSIRVSNKELLVKTEQRWKAAAGPARGAAKPTAEQKASGTLSARTGEAATPRPPPPEPTALAAPAGDVDASMQYLVRDGVQPFIYMYQREDGGEQMHSVFETKVMKITDGRPEAPQLSLDVHGVELVTHRTALSTRDFYEQPNKVWSTYYDEMRALVRQATGASRVEVFDHNVRNPKEAKWRRGVIGYVPYAHNDYTTHSAPLRVRDVARRCRQDGSVLPVCEGDTEEEEELLRCRYVIINVWRNISHCPVLADPLAVADGRTICDEDYVPADLVYKDRVGQTYSVAHGESHKWLYFSGMRKDEALLLKCYDSLEREGLVRWTAHTGFVDPRSPAGAPTRESVDARCIAFFREGDVDRMGKAAGELFPDVCRD